MVEVDTVIIGLSILAAILILIGFFQFWPLALTFLVLLGIVTLQRIDMKRHLAEERNEREVAVAKMVESLKTVSSISIVKETKPEPSSSFAVASLASSNNNASTIEAAYNEVGERIGTEKQTVVPVEEKKKSEPEAF